MKFYLFLFMFGFIITNHVLNADEITKHSTDLPESTKTTTSDKPTSTTNKPIPTTEKPETSTETTTSEKPKTTSEKPKTTSEEPKTTSEKPKTTETPSTTPETPSTTVKPPQPPLPGSWSLKEENKTCIKADLKVQFQVPPNGPEDYINLSPNATVDKNKSSCNSTNGTQVLVLTDADYDFTMVFAKDDTHTFVKKISLNYKISPATKGDVSNVNTLFSVSNGYSYLCRTPENVSLENVTMEIMGIQLMAFGAQDKDEFTTAIQCPADSTINDMVPITVGCALLALVVVVLIAYFVGRRRSRQRGYQSV